MTGILRRGDTPLFLRIFGVMLLAVLLVQMVNFGIVLATPPPQPTVTTVEHIVELLKGTAPDERKLRLRSGAIEEQAALNGRDLALRRLIAARLGIDENAVRVRSRGPGFGPGRLQPMFPGIARMILPSGGLPPGMPSAMSGFHRPGEPPQLPTEDRFGPDRDLGPRAELVLIGDFAVSARVDGTWRTVELQPSGFEPWRRSALLWLAVAMIVVAPVAWLLARRLARPIGLFADAARRLGRNPRSQPLELVGPPEIREAAGAFNDMQARLNRYVEDRTTLMAAIAHDLRTPLMRLNLRLEHVPADVRQSCEADIGEMEHMIAAVMAFVRDMNRATRRQKLDLRSLAESVTDGFVDAREAVTLHPGDPVVIEGDAPALKSLLSNLVSNAVKYAGSADVSLSRHDEMAFIEVKDDGPGMSVDDLEHAFEPFFRAERSRSRDTGGIGLGLASVRAVARAHGGEAILVNRAEGGLVARVTLPL